MEVRVQLFTGLLDEQWAKLIDELSQSDVIALTCFFNQLSDNLGIHAFLAMAKWCRPSSSRPMGTKIDPIGRSKSAFCWTSRKTDIKFYQNEAPSIQSQDALMKCRLFNSQVNYGGASSLH